MGGRARGQTVSRVGASLSDLVGEAQASTRCVDPQRLLAWMKTHEPLLLVDVREPDEFCAGHIPGALSIPRGLLEPAADREYAARDPELADARWRRVVLYCDCPTGARAAFAAEVLQRMGFQHVFYLAGGIGMWQAEGLPMELREDASRCYRRRGRLSGDVVG
jgi:rhodanese-related sulfurtransferase